MKITAIRTLVVHAVMRNWIFVRVETDQPGLHCWGEATLEWKTRAVVGAVEDLTPLLIGRDPRDIEQLVRTMHKHALLAHRRDRDDGHQWHRGRDSAGLHAQPSGA